MLLSAFLRGPEISLQIQANHSVENKEQVTITDGVPAESKLGVSIPGFLRNHLKEINSSPYRLANFVSQLHFLDWQ
jgi:hypothetical protein